MTLLQLLKKCKDNNVLLSAEAGKLIIQIPSEGIDPELRDALKAAKADLLPLVAAGGSKRPCPGENSGASSPSTGSMPLSPYQLPFWVSYSANSPGTAALNISEAFDFEKYLDPGLLQAAIDWTVARHDMLRVVFTAGTDGQMQQSVRDHVHVPLAIRTIPSDILSESSDANHGHTVHHLLEEFISAPYDLEHDAPLRAGIVSSPTSGSTIILGMPHRAGDAASFEVILKELVLCLDCREHGTPLPDERPPQYHDYLRWLNDGGMQAVASETHVRYWREQLQHLPPVHRLPTDFTRPTNRTEASFDFVMFHLPFSEALRITLQEIAISPFVYLHTALRIALYRFGRIGEIPMGIPMANRHHLAAPDATVGCFANEVALNIPLDADASIADALSQARNRMAEALDHQGAPYTDVIEAVCGQRSRDWAPIAQVFFSFLGLAPDLPVVHRFDQVKSLNYDLSFIVAASKGRMKLMLGYDKDLYRRSTINRLGNLFTRICAAMHEQLRESPAALELSAARQSTTEQPWNLERILSIAPDEKVLFFDDEAAPVLGEISKAVANAGAKHAEISAATPLEANGKTLLVTTRHPAELNGLLRGLPSNTLRICIVNNLPSAAALRKMANHQTNGMLLLEIPRAEPDMAPPLLATASLETCRHLRDNERYITCSVASDCCTAAPGELVELGDGLRVLTAETGNIRVPLPHTATPHVWHNGRALNLDTLAANWAQVSGEHAVALSLAPSPPGHDDRDKLTAWLVPGFKRGTVSTRLADMCPLLPANWPDYTVAVSAIPLTQAGEVDRHALEHLPLMAPELLPPLEDSCRTGLGIPAAFHLEGNAADPDTIHHSEVVPEAEQLSVKGEYSALGLSMAMTDGNTQNPSVAHGPSLKLDINLSFRDHLERFIDRELVFIDIDGNETHYTGQEFLQRAKNLLCAMQHGGLNPGDRIIAYCAQEQELYALAWACLLGGICMAGLIPPVAGQSPAPISAGRGHIHAILGDPAVITTRDEPMPLESANIWYFHDLLEEGARLGGHPEYHATQPDTLVYTAFTSGSTGSPKAVPLTASNVFSMIYAKAQTIGSIENETSLSMTALDHVASLFCNSIYSTVCGARQIFCPFQYILAAPERILNLIHKFRISHTWAPDFTWRQLFESLKKGAPPAEPWDLSCLRHIISAAENTREATFRNLEQALRPYGMPQRVLLHSWGMSETSSLLTMSDCWDEKSHESHKGIIDAGRPMAGSAFRVADKGGTPVPEGDVGSFQVKGPSVLGGYYNNPNANAESFTEDGWFITGDLAMLRNGKVIFCGREKEQVVIKGQNIAQFDIEGFVDGIDGIEPTFSVVIGCKNEKTGDDDILVFAHTKLTAPDERAAVIRKINATLASNFGVLPAQVLLVDQSDVPKALLGKIQRTNILKRFLKGEFQEQVREADMLQGNGKTFPNWFVRKGWSRENLPRSGMAELKNALTRTRIVITGPDTNTGQALARRLKELDADALHMPAPVVEEIRRHLASSAGASTIVYLLDKEPKTGSPAHAAWQIRSFAPLYVLTASLSTREWQSCSLMAVTTGGQGASKIDTQLPWTAAVAGLTSSLERQSDVLARVVDFDGNSTDREPDAIIREMAFGAATPLSSWRNGVRMVPTLHSVPLSRDTCDADWAQAFGDKRFCLCTGMTGRLGSILLPQLLLMTKGNFLVMGRKKRHEGQAILEEYCCSIPEWKKRTLYSEVSLEDAQSIQAAMNAASGYFSFGNEEAVKPGGILHLATDTAETGFQDVSEDDLLKGLRSRLAHLENLEQAFVSGGGTGPRIAFSSVLSFWGGPDSALYAPACALAEAYAHSHRATAASTNNSWHCFLWSRWRDATLQDDLVRLMEVRGFMTIDAPQGALSLLALLHRSANNGGETLIAGVNTTNPYITRHMKTPGHKVHPLKTLVAHVVRDARNAPLRSFLRERVGRLLAVQLHEQANPRFDEKGRLLPEDMDQAAHAPHAESRMASIWKNVLRLPHVDPTATFFELGGTSVLVPQLRKDVLEEFGMDLGSVGIFDYPSVREMARVVGRRFDNPAGAMTARDSASDRAKKQRAARRAR